MRHNKVLPPPHLTASSLNARFPALDEVENPPMPTIYNCLKPRVPLAFDGNCTKGCTFMNSCMLYQLLCMAEFHNDQAKIHWVLSYMKGNGAMTFADHIIWYKTWYSALCYALWNNFQKTFIKTFCLENESTHALMHLESDHYFHGKQTFNPYVMSSRTSSIFQGIQTPSQFFWSSAMASIWSSKIRLWNLAETARLMTPLVGGTLLHNSLIKTASKMRPFTLQELGIMLWHLLPWLASPQVLSPETLHCDLHPSLCLLQPSLCDLHCTPSNNVCYLRVSPWTSTPNVPDSPHSCAIAAEASAILDMIAPLDLMFVFCPQDDHEDLLESLVALNDTMLTPVPEEKDGDESEEEGFVCSSEWIVCPHCKMIIISWY